MSDMLFTISIPCDISPLQHNPVLRQLPLHGVMGRTLRVWLLRLCDNVQSLVYTASLVFPQE